MTELQQTIEQAKKGDQSSFLALYNETYPRNRYIAFRYLKQESDVDDVLQDAYIRIFKNLDRFTYNGESSFQSWTTKIVQNTAINYLRKKTPILFSETEDEEGNSVVLDIEDESVESQPELSYEKKEASAIVNELLDGLSDEQRIVVMMYYFQELSVKEIAADCSCSENTVKSRLNYARRNLEKKATDLKKKGILTTAFTMSVMAVLLHDDYASAAVGHGKGRIFQAISQGMGSDVATRSGTLSASTDAGKVTTAVKTIGKAGGFPLRTVVTIVTSVIAGAGMAVGIMVLVGQSSQRNNSGSADTTAPIETVTPAPAPTATVTSDPTSAPSETPVPEKEETPVSGAESPEPSVTPEETEPTEKPTSKPTRKPRRTPKPTREPRRTEEPTDWDDDFTDWDDDFTEWE